MNMRMPALAQDLKDALEKDRVIARLQRPDVLLVGLDSIGKIALRHALDQAPPLQHSTESFSAFHFCACCQVPS
jgi:hypothetical protein